MTEVDMDTGAVTYKPTFEWEAGVHPAADLFPMLDPDAFTALVGDIDRNGQRDPIWLDADGQLIDGRNRLAACQRLNRDPLTRTYNGDSPTELVLSLNVHRRQLTPAQLAAVAVDALPMLEAEAEQRRLANLKRGDEAPTGPAGPVGRSAEKAAEAVGVGATSVKRLKKVREASEETFEQVKNGEKSVREAEREVAPPPARSLVDDLRNNDDDAMKRMLHKKVMTALVGFGEPRKFDPARVAAALPDRDNQRVIDLLDAVENWLAAYREALNGDVVPLRSVK